MRRFPPPWNIEPLDGGGFKVVDASKQTIAYVYGHADPREAETANGLTLHEARRQQRLLWNCLRRLESFSIDP